MNAFFDGYVHSKTSLKQFVVQYERALRNKVEKEFQADFKSFLQMVPCGTQYEMERQLQSVYTISKFKEAQKEFMEKVYCDLVSSSAGTSGITYELREDFMNEGRRTKKTFFVLFEKEKCEFVCSCHLFEFRGIVCRHAIAVLIRSDVDLLPDRYVLRRWRRDISRAHVRVPVNYDGLVCSPEQLRYDEMCRLFAQVVDLAADDEGRCHAITDWIKLQCEDLLKSRRLGSASTVISQHAIQGVDKSTETQNYGNVNIRDPTQSKRKGAPRKLRKKGPLESMSKKSKASSRATKGKDPVVGVVAGKILLMTSSDQ